jgi:hypothetical protein
LFRIETDRLELPAPLGRRDLIAPNRGVTKSPSADPEASFEARVFASQIGWLETPIPDAAVEALCRVEVLLSQGLCETSIPIHHQLLILEAY